MSTEQQTQTETKPVAPDPSAAPPQKKSFPWLILILILGILLICCVAGSLIVGISLWKSSENTTSSDSEDDYDAEHFDWDDYWEENEEETTDEVESEPPTIVQFTGTYITAELPEEWAIVEYVDGEGSDMLAEQPYIGLTGLKIFTPNDDEAFWLKAVSGVGGVDACSTYYSFPDDNPAYQSQMQDLADELGMPMTIVEIPEHDSFYDFLGIWVKRVGYDLYKDRVPGNTFFEAACGINELMEISQLTFIAGGYESHTYSESISSGLSSAELVTLDGILESMAGI